jgi:hypothetical protein
VIFVTAAIRGSVRHYNLHLIHLSRVVPSTVRSRLVIILLSSITARLLIDRLWQHLAGSSSHLAGLSIEGRCVSVVGAGDGGDGSRLAGVARHWSMSVRVLNMGREVLTLCAILGHIEEVAAFVWVRHCDVWSSCLTMNGATNREGLKGRVVNWEM